MNQIVHPETLRHLLTNALNGESDSLYRCDLLALTLTPGLDPKGSMEWHGRFIGANASGVIVGAYTFRECDHNPTLKGLHLSNMWCHRHGRAWTWERIETRLQSQPVWWVPSDRFGMQKPCRTMVHRLQYMTNQIITNATNPTPEN